MAVTASLVINFGDKDQNGDANIVLDAEVNEDDNGGKTSFIAGDIVYFRIYHSTNYTVTQTAGSTSVVTNNVTTTITDEEVQFTFSATSSTDKLITTLSSYVWMGNNLGTITKSNYNEVTCGASDSIGVAKITYNTMYDLWQFNSPPSINGSDNYSVIIGITAI